MAALDMMKNVEVKLEPLDPAIVPQVNCNPEIPSKPAPKKRGRPKKIKDPNGDAGDKKDSKQNLITDGAPVKKKRERFKGTTEEEVLTRKLPDHLDYGLDIVIIGINPGLIAAYTGHYFAGPGNHFWKCLFLSGLIPHAMNAYDDTRLLEYGIGFTNIVERTSRGSADLSKKEIQEGAEILKGKIRKYKPRIAVFNGKGIYEIFSGSKKIVFGKQPEPFPGAEETQIFVMPSSSARFTQLPRAVDKVPFYEALKKFRNHLRGEIPKLEDSEITFPNLELKTAPRKEPQVKSEVKLEEPKEKKPAVKKPRKKRTFIQEPGPGHVTGGSTRLTKAHKSLIEQALMMSGDPSTTEGNQSTMPFPPLPQGFGEQQSQNPTDIQMGNNIQPAHDHMQQFFQQNEQMMHPSNAMGNFNPVTTAGSFMNPAALQSMGGGFGFNPNPNPQWNQFPNQGQYQQQGNNQFGFGNMMPSGQNNPQFDMNACHIIQPQINGALTDECNTVKIGINPGLTAAYTGHHYSGPGNHFWKCLFMSGLIPSPMNAYDDYKLIHYGIGFTNIVERTTRGSGDLSKKEIQEGAVTLTEKLRRFQPKIAVFNGKGIYEIFVGHKNFIFGKQPDFFPDVENTHVFVMPNSSARCSQLPRAADKLPFYTALKKLRDFLKGEIMRPHENELTFPDLQLKVFRKEKKVDGEASADTKTQSKAPPQQIPNGGTQRLNSQHHSLIQEAMMMSADAGQTDSNSPDARNLAQQYPNNPQGNLMHQQSGEMQGHGMGTTQQNDMFSHQQSQNQVRSPYFTQGHNEQFQNMYQQYMPRPQFFSQVKSENPSSASGSFTQNSEHAYQLAQGSGQQQFYQQQLTNQGHPQQQGYLQQQGNTVQNGNAQLPNNLQEYRGAQTGPNPGQIHPQVVEHPQQQQISPHYGQSREGHSAAQQLYHQQQWQQQQQQQQQGYHQQPNYQHQNYNQFQGYSGGMNTHQRMCQQRPQLQFIKKEPQVDPEEFKRWQNTQGDLQQFRNSQQEYFSQHVKPEMNSPVQQYPQQGYLQQGYTQHGYTPHSHIQQGHPHQGHMQQLHPHQGHMQQAHPHQGQGHPQQGFPPQVHTQQVHHQPVHTDHGPPQQGQTQQGYSQQGHPPQGQTQQGYSQRGHPQQGQTQQGYSQQGHPQQGQTQQGYTQQGHIQQGYPQQGQTQQVQSQQGHAQLRNTQQGHPQQSHPQQGPPQQGHPQQGHPKQNHPQQGHPQQGYPQQSHPDPQQIASQQEQGQFNQGNFYPLQNSAPNQGQGHHPNPGTGLQPENGNIQPWLPFIKSEKDVNSGDLNQGHVSAQEGNNHQGMQGFNANMPLVRDQIQNPMNRKEEPNIERVNSSPVKPQNDVNIAEQEKQLLSIKQELDTEVCNDDHNTQIHNDAQQGGVQAIVIKPEPGDGSQEKNQLPVPSEVTTPSVTNSDNQNQSVADLFCS